MRVLSLLCSLLLLVACSSNSSLGASAPEFDESKCSRDLPATDLAVKAASTSNGAVVVNNAEAPPETGYSRQFVLEEEVVESVRQIAEEASMARDHEVFTARTDTDIAPAERAPVPPLDKTFTLQLAALKERQQAIDYAQRHNFEAGQVGVGQILSKGQIWYILAYGVYTSWEAAEIAKSELQARGVPEPWIRSLATLEALSKEASMNGF